jgi:hypothetical protein
VRRGALLLALLALAATPAHGHVVFERPSLRAWVTGAELVVVAAFEGDAAMWSAPDGSDRQEYFRVRVEETLVGVDPGETLEFFPHAEGFPRFRAGDRALLFLERTDARTEFAALAARFPWFSGQGAGQEWRLAGAEGESALAAARGWLALRGGGEADLTAAVRAQLVLQLGSPSPRLRADAIAELVRMHALPGFLDEAGVTALAPFAASPALSIGQRLAIVRLLEGAPGFDPAPRLRALADAASTGSGAELAQMIGVAGASDDPALRSWLAGLAEDERPWVRRAVREALTAAALRAGDGAGASLPQAASTP